MGAPPWEYRVEIVKNPEVTAGRHPGRSLEERLNRLGAAGWELVAVTTTVKAVSVAGNDLVLCSSGRGSVSLSDAPRTTPSGRHGRERAPHGQRRGGQYRRGVRGSAHHG
jgi:Domain of unknown function (DUF4177)